MRGSGHVFSSVQETDSISIDRLGIICLQSPTPFIRIKNLASWNTTARVPELETPIPIHASHIYLHPQTLYNSCNSFTVKIFCPQGCNNSTYLRHMYVFISVNIPLTERVLVAKVVAALPTYLSNHGHLKELYRPGCGLEVNAPTEFMQSCITFHKQLQPVSCISIIKLIKMLCSCSSQCLVCVCRMRAYPLTTTG